MPKLALAVGAVGCSATSDPQDSSELSCGETRAVAEPIFYGSSRAPLWELSRSEERAIVTLRRSDGESCSGVVVADDWILTAAHCVSGTKQISVLVGDPRETLTSTLATQTVTHETLDAALVHAELPSGEVDSLSLMDEPLDVPWLGRLVQVAGRGLTENGSTGELLFIAEPIVRIDEDSIVVDGLGSGGACGGDSGGPLLSIAQDGSLRILGILSRGSYTCAHEDRYVRSDLLVDWVTARTGSRDSPQTPCRNVSTGGRCWGRTLLRCNDSTWSIATCPETCGWSTARSSWDCVDQISDACSGVPREGVCVSSQLSWCEAGLLKTVDCSRCYGYCGFDAARGEWACME
jgi:hypothetical protein